MMKWIRKKREIIVAKSITKIKWIAIAKYSVIALMAVIAATVLQAQRVRLDLPEQLALLELPEQLEQLALLELPEQLEQLALL